MKKQPIGAYLFATLLLGATGALSSCERDNANDAGGGVASAATTTGDAIDKAGHAPAVTTAPNTTN